MAFNTSSMTKFASRLNSTGTSSIRKCERKGLARDRQFNVKIFVRLKVVQRGKSNILKTLRWHSSYAPEHEISAFVDVLVCKPFCSALKVWFHQKTFHYFKYLSSSHPIKFSSVEADDLMKYWYGSDLFILISKFFLSCRISSEFRIYVYKTVLGSLTETLTVSLTTSLGVKTLVEAKNRNSVSFDGFRMISRSKHVQAGLMV